MLVYSIFMCVCVRVSVFCAGTLFRLKGNILCMALLDAKGALVTTTGDKWEESAGGGGSNANSTTTAPSAESNERSSKLAGNSKEAPAFAPSTPSAPSASGSGSAASSAEGRAAIVEAKRDKFLNVRSMTAMNVTANVSSSSASAGGGADGEQKQFAVICSEKQARVIALPSCVCLHSLGITESSVVLRAAIIKVKGLLLPAVVAIT